jgi:TetR/AcrR family transcriptional regulator, upper aerobic nicotinate degradation pathway regulator
VPSQKNDSPPAMTERKASAGKPQRRTGVREAAAQATRESILRAATKVFAKYGYDGGSVEKISKAAKSYDRMIYYYFGSKEGLYLAVLEEAYSGIRRAEATLDLETLPPEKALSTIVGFTFDYYNKHPEFVRLVMNENIMDGAHMARSKTISKLNVTVIDAMRRIVSRGQKARLFRRDIDPIELHMSISALGIFNVANRATFSTIFKRDMTTPRALAKRREEIVEIVLRHVRP